MSSGKGQAQPPPYSPPAYPPGQAYPGQAYPGQAYPPGPGYPPLHAVGGVPVVTTVQVGGVAVVPVVAAFSLGRHPVHVRCSSCHQEVVTAVESKPAQEAYIWCACIACFIACLGCCLIPFCMDSCKDYVHSCPNCHVVLGKHHG